MREWFGFDGQDAPEWLDEATANQFCCLLNSYIPKEYSRTGTRYHMLNRFPSGRLFFHLLNRPRGV